MTIILVGVDSGNSSTRAVEFAVGATHTPQAEIVVAHVINWSPFSFTTPADNDERHRTKLREIEHATEQIIAPMLEIANKSGLTVHSEIRHGQPARVLIELAGVHNAGQIVVGRSGESHFHEAVFGSVVGRLAQTSPIPVTVVP